jgi:hypothetical protein
MVVAPTVSQEQERLIKRKMSYLFLAFDSTQSYRKCDANGLRQANKEA